MTELRLKLPKSFFLEETRCGYTISSEMKKVWAVELDLLQLLIDVCIKYDLKLFASGGTLLGAIRHKGFIPWDDDIDMMMMREDYEKLCKIAPQEFNEPYFFQTEYTDPGSLRGHAQLRNSNTTGILYSEKGKRFFNQGIFIDIFPCDFVIDDISLLKKQEKKAKRYLSIAKFLSKYSYRYEKPKSLNVKKIIKICLYPVMSNIIKSFHLEQKSYKKFEEVCSQYNNKDLKMISLLSFQFDNELHYKYYEDYLEMNFVTFETIKIPIGNNPDRNLQIQYGDFMCMKKENSYHGNVYFNTEESYLNFEPFRKT